MIPLCIKVDVDTHDGMRDGVPRLLECFHRHGVRATFFLVLGPDRMGMAMVEVLRRPRFLLKMLGTGAPSLYGWRTILSGTLLPARPVATAFPDLVRRLEAEGHEAAVHAWDHRAWQDHLPEFKPFRVQLHLDRAVEALRRITGRAARGIGAPAWMTTPGSLAAQDALPFTYASDLRASPPCRLVSPAGTQRLGQFPGSGACLEELLPRLGNHPRQLADALFNELQATPGPLRVLTLHAEVEGGPYLPVLDQLLPRLAEHGPVLPMESVCPPLTPTLPVRRWRMRRLPGRAFPVSTSSPVEPQ